MPPKISHHLATLTLTILLLLTTLTTTSGIDCKGTKQCHGLGAPQNLPLLEIALNESSDTATFANGANIACVPMTSTNLIDGAICVWMWNTDNSTTGAEVKVLYQAYKRHGCKVCGNVPTDGAANDDSRGEMTVGWSGGTACDGVCNAMEGSDYLPGDIVPGAGLMQGEGT